MNVSKIKIQVPGKRIKLLVLKPSKCTKKGAGLLWIHGGGYSKGKASMVFKSCVKQLVDKYGITIISPEYRLSKEAPYPYPMLDCAEALLYMKTHAEELNIRTNQIMIAGEEAGGGLAAAVSLYSRDHKTVNISAQFLIYPMLDNESNPHLKTIQKSWNSYLRNLKSELPSYAVAAKETDYRNLPPCYSFVGYQDPLYNETMQYIKSLKLAGVHAEVDVYANCSHAFDVKFPWRKESRKARKQFEKKFEDTLNSCFCPQND